MPCFCLFWGDEGGITVNVDNVFESQVSRSWRGKPDQLFSKHKYSREKCKSEHLYFSETNLFLSDDVALFQCKNYDQLNIIIKHSSQLISNALHFKPNGPRMWHSEFAICVRGLSYSDGRASH